MTIRINLYPNPTVELNTIGFTGVECTLTSSADRAHAGSKSMKIVWNAKASGELAGPYSGITLVGSTLYTVSAWVWVPTGSPRVFLNVQSNVNAKGAWSTKFDQWERISLTFTTNATSGSYNVFLINAEAMAAGTICYADEFLLELGSALGSAFNGDTVKSGFSYGWLGLLGESRSYEILGDGGRVNRSPQPSMEGTVTGLQYSFATGAISTDRAHSGTKSLKVTCDPSKNAFNAGYKTPTLATILGRVYTMSYWVWVPSGNPAVVLRSSGFNMPDVYSSPSTLYDQWQRLSVTFTSNTPPGSYPIVWILNNTATPVGGAIFYVDDTLLEETAAVNPYFDGSTIDPLYTIAWVGAANESESYKVLTAITVVIKSRESGVWVQRTASPKVRVAGAWVVKRPKRWKASTSTWVDL